MLRSDGANTQIYTNTAHDLGIYTSGNVGQLHLKQSNGNVGIGTSSPSADLHLKSTTSGNPELRLEGTGAENGIITFLGGGHANPAVGLRYISSGDSIGNLAFYANSSSSSTLSERMRIDSSGKVGIGTTAPLNLLQIGSSNPITMNGDYPDIHFNAYYSAPSYRTVTTGFGSRLSFHPGTGKLTIKTGASSTTAGSNYSGAEVFGISAAGIVTAPYQPNFLARIPSGSVAITSNGWATFNFNSTALGWDKGGNFTSSTKRFTAPVAGVYFFQWLIQVESITDAPTWYYAYPTVNGSGSFGTTNGMSAADQVEPVGVYHAMKGTQSLQLAASDYVEMRYFWDNGNGNLKGGGESMWAGHLIG
jgi:hypothetical protein